jgi:hypothetical protein
VRKSTLRLYAPFIALAMAQAAFVVVAPSKGESNQNVFASGPLSGAGAGAGATANGATVDPATGQAIDPATGQAVTAGGSGGAATGGAASSGSGAAAGTAAAGDTRHCRNGRQTDVIFNAPPCAAKFTGDNGGATYPGVTAKEIKLVLFECQPNEQVNAILATQGLAASQAETDAMVNATIKVMNEKYEFYGRKIVWEHVIGDCPLTPPDPAKSRQAAAEVAKTKPAFVIHYAAGPESHDVWSQNGIVSLGGPNLDASFYAGRRPFRYDVFPSGSESADQVAEYYCKKLAGKPASNAGQIIHQSIGGRTTKRHLGVVVPDNGNGASVPNAKRVAAKVKECAGEDVPFFTYSSDINRAEEQTRVTVAALIKDKVTTVACMCDAIAPVFLTKGMTANNYFPEHELPGGLLLDYDVLGRLYDTAQWEHSFGPSQLVNPVPFDQSDATRLWRAAGNSGQPCGSCNLITGYMVQLGTMIQQAGPNLNPLTVERGLVGVNYRRGGWAETKGNPSQYLIKFGQGDYNAISDYREVYWSNTARSDIDGKNGAYVSMNGGRRYDLGEIGRDFNIPVKPQ